ncbi:PQQ-binding-like beta-propeller repeat protein [Kitasatospora sp. NPDC085464]|uniref:serine/threonine-protein kinase n=1 Tax=Kitasatospora sp. NPDC085464 TaxID=3364063 RepID=UPI0037CC71D9
MSTQSVGPYRILRNLGAGGMGAVYLAATGSGRPVAVKTVQQQYATDVEFRRRFAQEVAAARSVNGAYTVAVVDADTEAEVPWLATEFVAGPSLHQAVARHGALAGPALQTLGAGLVEALAAIHRARIIHRDLKPSNILVARDGPRVIDFGISKPTADALPTANSRIIGTPGFMSPEHAAGLNLTPASDLFSLGAVLAFAATGRAPFGEGPPAVLIYRASEEPPDLDGVPPELTGLLVRCLDRDPARRPAPAELTEAFRYGPAVGTDWLGEAERTVRRRERELARVLSDPNGTRRRLLVLGGALLATAAAGGLTRALWPGTSGAPPTAWSVALPRAGMAPVGCGPAAVVCADRTGIVGYDRSDGRVLWNSTTEAGTLPVGDGGRVWSVDPGGVVQARDARTGATLWRSSDTVPGAQSVALPLPGLLLVTGPDGALHGYDAAGGRRLWSGTALGTSYRIQGMPSAGLLIVTLLGDLDRAVGGAFRFVALDSATGRPRWSLDAQDLYAPPSGSRLYALAPDLALAAVDGQNGTSNWSVPSGLPPASATMFTGAYLGSLSLRQGVVTCLPVAATTATDGRTVTAAFDTAGARLWIGSHTGAVTGCADDGAVVVTGGPQGASGVDLHTGNTTWTWPSAQGAATVRGATGGSVLVTAPTAAGGITLQSLTSAAGTPQWHQTFARQPGAPQTLTQDSLLLLGYGPTLTAYHLSAG